MGRIDLTLKSIRSLKKGDEARDFRMEMNGHPLDQNRVFLLRKKHILLELTYARKQEYNSDGLVMDLAHITTETFQETLKK